MFTEKPMDAYCNGGYMVMNKKIFFNNIKNNQSILEINVLPKLAKRGELSGYKHYGLKCIDNMKDKIEVEKNF